MSTEPNRQPEGIPTGGQYAAKVKSDDVPALGSVAVAEPKQDQEWHDGAAALVEGGRTPEEARGAISLVLASKLTDTYLQSGQAANLAGHTETAAMYVIAYTAMRDLPRNIHNAGSDQDAVRTALASARSHLNRSGDLLDRMHPTGRQPIFRNADDVLARLEAFNAPEPAGASS
jgi:hypothetical protein